VTVRALTDAFECRPSDLVAAVGPSIGPCCYEVGADVRSRFAESGFAAAELARWFLEERRPSATNPSSSGSGERPRAGHWFLDVWTAARDQLVAAGVPAHQVLTADLCTASHAGMFCSYRRDGIAAGRMATAIKPRDAA
jgi:copper oxidase (laccase) domain-containing protein